MGVPPSLDGPWSVKGRSKREPGPAGVARVNRSGTRRATRLMADKDIAALPVAQIAAEHAALFLWATWPKRLSAGLHQVVESPTGAHSSKPIEVQGLFNDKQFIPGVVFRAVLEISESSEERWFNTRGSLGQTFSSIPLSSISGK